jgi:hypothetical protein
MMKPPVLTEDQKAIILGDPEQKPLAIGMIRQHSPRQSISPWNMFYVLLPDVLPRWVGIEKTAEAYHVAAYDPQKQNQNLSGDEFVLLHRTISNFQFIGSQLELEKTLHQADQFKDTIGSEASTHLSIHLLLKNLLSTAREEMSKRIFTRIPISKVKYYERDGILGLHVDAAFPDAAPEIRAAGNCLAADLNTAAVFHLMRASELGLRCLAVELNAWQKPFPVKFAEWREVINSIKVELQKLESATQQTTKCLQKDASLAHYRLMLADINHIKIARDRVMHMRETYDSDEAEIIFRRVKEFMDELAQKSPLK